MAEAFDNPLERYQIMDPLGRGGSGHTFRAVDRATSQQVAIKVLSLRDVGGDWKRFDLFEREVAVLRTLDHPGIPRFLDSYSSEGTGDFFLVMELCDGRSLRQHLAEGKRLSAARLRALLDQGLTILEYLHGLSPPVIHRDIKPANLVLDVEGRLRLVDFGGVKRAAHQDGGTTVIGTFGYMAPEQLHGEAGPATDLYALGATIVALHAGTEADQLPHDGLRIDLAALSLPPPLEPVLRHMLEPDPRERVRSVAEVRRLLDAPARERRPTPVSPTRMVEPPVAEPPTTALAVTSGLRSLARVPAPLSVLVWLLSAIGAGGLTVFQVVLLPLIVAIARQFSRNEPATERARLEGNLAQLEATVGEARRSLSYVAKETHPIRDER
ncbi:serine/threonine-protein kinase [Paraliomyxa miuraensis]|uniref:serine/threonine-protein kinase n=1 Tax=Paraliomyxa miuraensis TaxID=376150 RepID=UPI0022581FF8|nr:serine/threonine-protein kinase [Paraliomyxa miuraensis]MCX4244350.1 serine/threonine protein kinase [Paraliomyxa miuraensis]